MTQSRDAARTPADETMYATEGSLRAEQQQEAERAVLGTAGQWHGALVILPLIRAAFGAVAGGVYQGGRNPEREGELETAFDEPDPSAAVASNPHQADEH